MCKNLQGCSDQHKFLQTLTQMPVEKKLWIVEIARIRVRQLEDDEESGVKEKADNGG